MRRFFLILAAAAICMAAAGQSSRYGVKSGILKLVASTGGPDKTEQTQYFDRYGAEESVTYTMDIPGIVTYDIWMITKGADMWSVTVTDGKRAVKKSQNPTPDLNFLKPTPEAVQKYNLQEVGEERFLNRNCKVFTYETKQGRRTVQNKAWVYKGVILKSEMQVGRRTATVTAVEFKENVRVPDGVFNTGE